MCKYFRLHDSFRCSFNIDAEEVLLFLFQFDLRVQPYLFAFYQWRAEDGWLVTSLSNMQVKFTASLTRHKNGGTHGRVSMTFQHQLLTNWREIRVKLLCVYYSILLTRACDVFSTCLPCNTPLSCLFPNNSPFPQYILWRPLRLY